MWACGNTGRPESIQWVGSGQGFAGQSLVKVGGIELLNHFHDLLLEILIGLVNVVDVRRAHHVLNNRLSDELERLLEVKTIELVITERLADQRFCRFVLGAIGKLGVVQDVRFRADLGHGLIPDIFIGHDKWANQVKNYVPHDLPEPHWKADRLAVLEAGHNTSAKLMNRFPFRKVRAHAISLA
jgi:hypothetical protein